MQKIRYFFVSVVDGRDRPLRVWPIIK